MVYTKKRTWAWCAGGLLLSLLVLLVVSGGLAGKVLVTDPQGIPEAAEAVMTCIQMGDWEELQQRVSGNPDLAPETGEEGSAEALIWNAYRQSLHWVCADDYDFQDGKVTQRITVTCLDISGVTRAMAPLLPESADSAQRESALEDAARQALHVEAPMQQREITLSFQRENGRWQAVPDSALLALLSGFTNGN